MSHLSGMVLLPVVHLLNGFVLLPDDQGFQEAVCGFALEKN